MNFWNLKTSKNINRQHILPYYLKLSDSKCNMFIKTFSESDSTIKQQRQHTDNICTMQQQNFNQ